MNGHISNENHKRRKDLESLATGHIHIGNHKGKTWKSHKRKKRIHAGNPEGKGISTLEIIKEKTYPHCGSQKGKKEHIHYWNHGVTDASTLGIMG